MKKKILSLMLAVCVVLGLSACGGEEEVEDALVCTMEQSGMTFTMRMDAKGDTVTNVEQETVISTEGFTEDQIQQLRAAIEEAAAAYEAIEGTEYTTEEGDGEIREVITIPVADEEVLKAVIEQGLLPVDGDDVSEISLEQTRESLEASGWKIKTYRSTPLKILEMVMLHQIPLSPRAVLVRTRAMGIRRAVNTILVTEGGSVRPNPEKAPAVVSSTLMKS